MTEAALAPGAAIELAACRAVVARHSRSFALASALLGRTARDHAAALYAWCRAADDAVDAVPADQAAAALAAERAELARAYDGAARTRAGRALAAVVRARALPRAYPAALLDGMAMDVAGTRYRTVDDLFVYAHRVAGVVGLMMCHVLGVRDDRALVPAAHLGVAMQLTNVCRDVGEDWGRGRLYLPDELLARHRLADLADQLGDAADPARPAAPPPATHAGLHAAQRDLLALADRYYASATRGYRDLPARAAAAIRTAARVYRAIGAAVVRLGPAAVTTRAVVGGGRKALHVGGAVAASLAAGPARLVDTARGRRPRPPQTILELADVPRL